MYDRYSRSIACVFTTYLVFLASYMVSTFVFVVFSSQSCGRANKRMSRDQVLAEQQKGPNFERKIGKFKFSILSF